MAINVKVSQRAAGGDRGDGALHQGYIAALKDGYGFIENLAHDMEVFFHFRYVRTGKSESTMMKMIK